MLVVPTRHLKAALLVAGKQDVRFYLNGVFLEALPTETRCTGLNGSAGVVLRSLAPMDPTFCAALIVPRDVVAQAVTMKRPDTTFEPSEDGHWQMNGVLRFKPIDGTFPSYRRVMPSAPTGQAPRGFDPESLALFGKMAQALGKKSADITTHCNGTGGAAITLEGYPDFAGVVMPLNFTKAMGENGQGVSAWAAS